MVKTNVLCQCGAVVATTTSVSGGSNVKRGICTDCEKYTESDRPKTEFEIRMEIKKEKQAEWERNRPKRNKKGRTKSA